jgi:hypothetical protein
MHWKQVQKQSKSKILMQMIPKPLLMIQYELMRTLFPWLPQVHPIKRKKPNGKEMSETTTKSSTRKRTKTSDA